MKQKNVKFKYLYKIQENFLLKVIDILVVVDDDNIVEVFYEGIGIMGNTKWLFREDNSWKIKILHIIWSIHAMVLIICF